MPIPFYKMHGLGNDFVIIDRRQTPPLSLNTDDIRLLADRRLGVGCDQVIIIEPSEIADCHMLIYNPDGSQAGACGNATRCVAMLIGAEHATIEVMHKILHTTITTDGMISVNMGKASYGWRDIPLAHQIDTSAIRLLPELPAGACVNVGNPHLVFFMQHIMDLDLAKIGPWLEHHALFIERVNVSFVKIIDRQHIAMRTWERGVGETLACGSAACAAVAVGHRLGVLDSAAHVGLQHGSMLISITEDGELLMTGPATLVAEGVCYWH